MNRFSEGNPGLRAWRKRLGAAKAVLADGARDERGVVAIIFALAVVVLVPLVLGLFDVYTASEQRAKLQDALDAAALYAARGDFDTDAEVDAAGDKVLAANLKLIRGATLISSDFHLTNNGTKIVGSATIQPMALAPALWSHPAVTTGTEAVRSSKNLEVALVLDLTQSMSGTKVSDLRTAAKQLVDLVVKDQQTPYYSKVALVPWSAGVNLGAYADQARGAATPARGITAATKANPVVITSNGHGFANDDVIYIKGVNGMTQLNDKVYTVKNKTNNKFELWTTDPTPVKVNGGSFNNYTNGGGAYCTTEGCEYYRFSNANSGAKKVFQISTCVSERIGANSYTDVAPSTSPVGRNYPAQNAVAGTSVNTPNPCLADEIVPLSTDRTMLKNKIDDYDAAGSTGGQVGTAWGWYMVSPNFGYLWPAASRPAAYGLDDTMKVVVMMTDGALNTSYCNGVISQDSLSGSGSSSDHINCNATNGTTFTQASTLCTKMKEAGVIVYAVGFQISGDATATTFVNNCASSPTHVYLPNSGTALSDAFKAIGQDINGLRLAH